VVLLVGGTGELGRRIARRLSARKTPFRALVRQRTDASELRTLGAETIVGDLRDRRSLEAAAQGTEVVITTVTAIGRALAGERGATLRDVDLHGNANLIDAAEAAGVARFTFVSFVIGPGLAGVPLAEAKRATEERLARSRMTPVVVRPEMFQEVWLSELVGFDWRAGKVRILGRGTAPHAYVATDDVAEATVRLALDREGPSDVAFGGPEALTRREVVERFERAGRTLSTRHVPRAAMRAGSIALRRFKPIPASLMAMALDADRQTQPLSAEPLRDLGIDPRPVGAYIDALARPDRAARPPEGA
jgi:NADH dehydrogenase